MNKFDTVLMAGDESAEHFYSLVRRAKPRSRTCLGKNCGRSFISRGQGNRICSTCSERNAKVPHKMIFRVTADSLSKVERD